MMDDVGRPQSEAKLGPAVGLAIGRMHNPGDAAAAAASTTGGSAA